MLLFRQNIQFRGFRILNTDLGYKDISEEVMTLFPGIPFNAYVEGGMVFIRSSIPAGCDMEIIELLKLPEKYSPRVETYGLVSFGGAGADIGKIYTVIAYRNGLVKIAQVNPMVRDESFVILYPLKHG